MSGTLLDDPPCSSGRSPATVPDTYQGLRMPRTDWWPANHRRPKSWWSSRIHGATIDHRDLPSRACCIPRKRRASVSGSPPSNRSSQTNLSPQYTTVQTCQLPTPDTAPTVW